MAQFDIVKPDEQIIGDGYIVWQWQLFDGATVVESILSIRDDNETSLPAGRYVTTVKLPEPKEAGDPVYAFPDEAAETLGAALVSAWRWQDVWIEHAGEYLYELLKTPLETATEDTEAEEVPADGEV